MSADPYGGKLLEADAAVARVGSGRHVLIGSGAAEPQRLVSALAARSAEVADTEVLHLLTLGIAPYAQERFEGSLRHNALFIGPNVRGAVQKGLADYTPCLLSEIPRLIRSGRLPVDAALIQTTPAADGKVNLGVSVDILRAAVEAAEYVVAQVNPRMPWTCGDTLLDLADIDAFVPAEEPLAELPFSEPTAAALWIGRYIARLVPDGATLQIGIGALHAAVLGALAGKKDLGIHSEMISDGVLDLLEQGALTGARKSLHAGKVIASFCLGSRRLYEAVARNPRFEFHPSDYVNDPAVIGANDRMVAVNSALEVDLTGQVGADSVGHRLYSGVGGQLDFIRGAARSREGLSIIALPSTAKEGALSRIVCDLAPGTGVVTTRADLDFVVTEYGIASLKAKSLRERAIALISIAHPDHRPGLIEQAQKAGLLDAGHVFPLGTGAYVVELETRRRFGDEEVFFRPLKPSDERRLKDLFYSQSQETTWLRFGIPLKRLSERTFQELVAIDMRGSMAIGGFAKEGGRERLIAVGRYAAGPGERLAEAAFTVTDHWQGRGVGTFLVDYLSSIAQERGLDGFLAEVSSVNRRMERVFSHCFRRMATRSEGPGERTLLLLFSDRKPLESAVRP